MTHNAVTQSTPRLSAEARREHLLEVATQEFAERGYVGGSTERIAQAAGISQPYVFRLFGSKQQLFIAVVQRCMDDTYEMFRETAAGLSGDELLQAIGHAYGEMITSHPARLRAQLAGYAACGDPAVRDTMRAGFARVVQFVERGSGLGPERIASFFGKGMLLNVLTAMGLEGAPEGWGDRLIAGCMHPPEVDA